MCPSPLLTNIGGLLNIEECELVPLIEQQKDQ